MQRLSRMLSDRDLEYVVGVLMPGSRDRQSMVSTLRKDEEILVGMLRDERLVSALIRDEESLVRVSPSLFFSVLIERVALDMKQQSYTIERSRGQQLAVFDSGAAAELLKESGIRFYLTDMLVSFVRINSVTIPIRVKKGIWRKIRISDFDIESLVRYSTMIEESQRFGSYKRIADICLFTMGMFPEHLDARGSASSHGRARFGNAVQLGRDGMEKFGRKFYDAASRHEAARIYDLRELLSRMAEHFVLMTKPLNFISDRYLRFQKEKYFLQ
jgi:hypothetical protein